MKKIHYTNRFKKQLFKQQERGKNLKKFKEIARKLSSCMSIENRHRNHKLTGKYEGKWECHIEPDWLLIYSMDSESITCEYTGTHSDLF